MPATLRRLRAHIPSQYLWPLLLLKGVSFGCIILLLFLSTRGQDELQRQREEQALGRALTTAAAMARRDLQDYAKWDDAVRHIGLRFQPDWVDDNVVAYLGRTQAYGHVFVLDEQDRTIFDAADRNPIEDAAARRLGRDFLSAIALVRSMPRSGSPIVSGYTRADGKLLLFSAAQIVPLTDKVQLKSGATKLLVIARAVDSALLAELTGDLKVDDVRLLMRPPLAGRESLVVTGFSGKPLAWLEWKSHQPGTVLRRQLVPPVAALLIIGVLAAGLILRRCARAVDDLEQSELRARHLSDHDLLTGLPNRRALIARIGDGLMADDPLALLFMDLDGFKDANDVYGHGAGDLLLREAAERIRAAAGQAFVARVGGDEFAVLLSPCTDGEAALLCEVILAQFTKPFSLGAYNIRLGISIGYSEARSGENHRQGELMRRADVAMYAAKAAGKNCARAHLPSLDEGHHLRIRLENDLRRAVEANEIFVRYQPIVEASTGDTIAVEALARWTDPVHGDVPPDIFIPIAEMSGLINAIGRQVLVAACRAMRDTRLELAVNLSPAQFWDGGLLGEVRAVLEETGFPPERLELEITESLMLRRPEAAAEVINSLRALGIRIALDDFGTGFASIGYLQQLKFDRLKIDKAFIEPLDANPCARDMLVSITGLARACSLEVCAEGIETESQARYARMAGCSRLQGWLFGRPQEAANIVCAMDSTAVPIIPTGQWRVAS